MSNFFILINMNNNGKPIRAIKKQFNDSCVGSELIKLVTEKVKNYIPTMKMKRIVYYDKDFQCNIDVNDSTFFNEKAILEVFLEEVRYFHVLNSFFHYNT